MGIFYGDEITGKPFSGMSIKELDPNVCYAKHLSNYFHLTFIKNRSDDRKEVGQALKEIVIAERKMNYWKKHPDFSVDAAGQAKNALIGHWNFTVSYK